MALSPEDVEQIRAVVRMEMAQIPPRAGSGKWILLGIGLPLLAFMIVLMLHVVVIGGFTIYHLMHS
jgi:hypothetical protein